MVRTDGEKPISNDDFTDVVDYSRKLISSLIKCGYDNTASTVANLLNDIISDMEYSLGE